MPMILQTIADAPPAIMDWRTFRERLQPHLDAFIESKTAHYARYSDDALLRDIWDYPRRLVAARGKRLRPYVAYLMYRALGGDEDDDQVLRLLVALELFHLFCLIHDDIVDNGEQRHGLPTVQRFVSARLRDERRLQNHEHENHEHENHERIGNAQALLLGDMVFAWAQEAFHAGDFDCETMHEARRYFGCMIDEVVIGEMLDVDMMTRRRTTTAAIHQKMLLKTASYTFIRPLQIGAALARCGDATEAFCHDFGLALGIAFQVQDDWLDLVGAANGGQKTAFSDLREHQHTCFTQYIFECGTDAEKAALHDLMGRDLSARERECALDLFESSGALSHGRALIRRHLAQACGLLDDAPAPLSDRRAFYELISTIQHRAW